ncbi:MAG: hypothetical protein WCR02_11975 [Sphaerochaetaceae bacterium]
MQKTMQDLELLKASDAKRFKRKPRRILSLPFFSFSSRNGRTREQPLSVPSSSPRTGRISLRNASTRGIVDNGYLLYIATGSNGK